MRNVRNLALASGAAFALVLGAALAQDAKQPAQKHEHGDAEHAKNHAEHMQRMGKMNEEMHNKHEKRERHGEHEHSRQEQNPR